MTHETMNERSGISGLMAALDYTPGRLDETAPAFIWLQVDTSDDTGFRGDEWPGSEEVTWQDESLGGLEIAYVRADLVDRTQVIAGDAARLVEVLKAIGSAFAGIPAPCDERDAIAAAIAALSAQPAPSEQVAASVAVPDAVLAEVQAEMARAVAKFPTWPSDPLHACGVVQEESGELAKAVLQAVYEPHKSTRADVRSEAVQTAAMAIRFVQSLDADAYDWTPGAQHQQGIASLTPQEAWKKAGGTGLGHAALRADGEGT